MADFLKHSVASSAVPTIVFALPHSNDTGYVWNSMMRAYDAAAALLEPRVRCVIAHPKLCSNPALSPAHLEAVEANFYDTSHRNRPALSSIAARYKPRIVVYMGCPPSDISLRFLRNLGLRTISYEQHSKAGMGRESLLKFGLKVFLRRWLQWNIHDAYVANSEHQRQYQLSVAGLPANRMYMAVNGVDTESFAPGPAPTPGAYHLPSTEHYAVSISQARPEKRIDFLIDVAARVFQLRPTLSLTFVHVGAGVTLKACREKVASLGLESRFCFAGFQNVTAPFHRLATVFVHAADRESLSFAILEAMATGKPVVACKALGPCEIVQDRQTGFLIDQDDLDDFAQAVLLLIDHPELRSRMGQASLSRVRECYSLKRQAQDLAQVIQQELRKSIYPTGE